MKRATLVLLALFFIVSFYGVSPASAGRTVMDSSGKVIIEDATAEDIPALVGLLDRKGAVEAVRARDILVELGEDAVPALLDALDSGPAYENVMYALGQIMDKRAIKPVAAYINDEQWERASIARGVLGQYGDAATDELIRLMSDPAYFEASIDVLRTITPSKGSLDKVRKLTGSENPSERAGSAYLLGQWIDVEFADTVTDMIRDEDDSVREYALNGYRMMYLSDREKYDTGLLTGFLKDPNPRIRESAVRMLADKTDRQAVEPLLEVISNDPDREIRAVAIEALENKMDNSIIVPLIKVVSDKDAMPDEISNAVYILGQLKAKEAVPYIEDMFRRGTIDDGGVLQVTFNALRFIGEPVELAIFMPYLKEGNPHYVGTDQLLSLLEVQAKPGDEEVASALREFIKAGAKKRWEDRARAILERIE